MYTYPHTIESGGGEVLTFLRRVQFPDGEGVETECWVSPGSGPPMHVHNFQEEGFTVQKGRMGYQVKGKEPQYAEAGAHVTFKPNVPHKFWNAGEDELHCVGIIKPPDSIEYFLTELYASTKANGGKRPNILDAAFLMGRYKAEFTMVEIPAAVRNTLFPILRTIGRLTGRYRKYKDAPQSPRG